MQFGKFETWKKPAPQESKNLKLANDALENKERTVINKQEVVTIFNIEGKNSEKGLELYFKWLDQEYQRRDLNEITEMELFITQAELLSDCGRLRDAIDSYEQVADQAWQEQDLDLVEKCNQAIDKLIERQETETEK